jgi:ketosteroid isomerase-like protein
VGRDEQRVREANERFYESLRLGDLDRMIAVWSAREELSCVHPGWEEPLVGRAAVVDSWERIFAHGGKVHVESEDEHVVVAGDTAIAILVEEVYDAAGTVVGAAQATNVFVREPGGWFMVHHHASPLPVKRVEKRSRPPGPATLN